MGKIFFSFLGSTLGSKAGAVLGGYIGASIGTVALPGLGTLSLGMLGTAIGSLAGGVIGAKVAETACDILCNTWDLDSLKIKIENVKKIEAYVSAEIVDIYSEGDDKLLPGQEKVYVKIKNTGKVKREFIISPDSSYWEISDYIIALAWPPFEGDLDFDNERSTGILEPGETAIVWFSVNPDGIHDHERLGFTVWYDENGWWPGGRKLLHHFSQDFYASSTYFEIEALPEKVFYHRGETATVKLKVKCYGSDTSVQLGVSFKEFFGSDIYDAETISPPDMIFFSGGEEKEFTATWNIPLDAKEGLYQIAVNCWYDPYNDAHYYPDNLTWSNIFYIEEPPNINILSPTSTSPVKVGSYARPIPFEAHVSVVDSRGTAIMGLGKENFRVYITDGSSAETTDEASFSVIFDISINAYKFVISPPIKDSGGEYSLIIELVQFNDKLDSSIAESSVIYSSEEVTNVEVVLVIDRSGSMNEDTPTRISQAKAAAKQFVDLLKPGDKIAVVSFSTAGTTTVNVPLTEIKDNIDITVEEIYVESPHPYPNEYDETWTLEHPSATWIRVHFQYIKTESNYDYVYVEDANGHVYNKFSGHYADLWSSWVSGEKLIVRLTSDKSITYDGFVIDKIAWTTISGPPSTTKEEIKEDIESIVASGYTAMGEGLRYGLHQLTTYGDPSYPQAMILLSDGFHNDGENPRSVVPDIKAEGIKVYTIGLGSEVDQELLSWISHETEGTFYISPTLDELKAIYNSLCGVVKGESTLLYYEGTINPGETQTQYVPIDSTCNSAYFSASVSGSQVTLILQDPFGRVIDNVTASIDPNITYVKGSGYETYIIDNIESGLWTIEVRGTDVSYGETYHIVVNAESRLNLVILTDKDEYHLGEPVQVNALLLTHEGRVLPAFILANITAPYLQTIQLQLYDDGAHNDGMPADGLFSNYFIPPVDGTYTISVIASGLTPRGDHFIRTSKKSVYVRSEECSLPVYTSQSSYKIISRPGLAVRIRVELGSTEEINGVLSVTDLIGDSYIIPASNIHFDRRTVTLYPGVLSIIEIEVAVPHEAPTRLYQGDILFLSSKGTISVPLILEVKPFNVTVSPREIQSYVEIGEDLRETINISIIGYGGLKNLNAKAVGEISNLTSLQLESRELSENSSTNLYLNIHVPRGTINVLCGSILLFAENSTLTPIGVLIIPTDSNPPTTSCSPPGGVYFEAITVNLTANDEESGVSATYYRIGDGEWRNYTGPFKLSGIGEYVIYYYSIDRFGNIEEIKSTTYVIKSPTSPLWIYLAVTASAVAVILGITVAIRKRRKTPK